MTNTLHRDTYYRGYRLSTYPNGRTIIWFGTDKVDNVLTLTEAQTTIDTWQEAK